MRERGGGGGGGEFELEVEVEKGEGGAVPMPLWSLRWANPAGVRSGGRFFRAATSGEVPAAAAAAVVGLRSSSVEAVPHRADAIVVERAASIPATARLGAWHWPLLGIRSLHQSTSLGQFCSGLARIWP